LIECHLEIFYFVMIQGGRKVTKEIFEEGESQLGAKSPTDSVEDVQQKNDFKACGGKENEERDSCRQDKLLSTREKKPSATQPLATRK